jgi:oligopeptide transport system permease protein
MYYFKRILMLAPLLLLISLISFFLLHVAPGGPFDKDRKSASPEIERQLNAKYHLDEPLWRQYGRFLKGAVRGDLGPSLKYRNHTVADLLLQGLPISLLLGMLAFGVSASIGIPLGFHNALARRSWRGHLGSLLAISAVCIPVFVLGPLLVMVVALYWRILPPALWESPAHVILPALTLGLYYSGKVAGLMREGMLKTRQAEFITTARAKGLPEWKIYLKHAMPLAILPVVSYSGPLLADLLTGSFVVENLFQIPGIGVFMVNSSLNRDYPMVVGTVLLYAILLMVLNLLVDWVYSRLDPRVQYQA